MNYFYISLYAASPNGMMFRPNITAYKNGVYKMIGQMIAICLMQGGEPPAIFAPPVVDYLLSGDISRVKARISDVPNQKVREDLEKVLRVSSSFYSFMF